MDAKYIWSFRRYCRWRNRLVNQGYWGKQSIQKHRPLGAHSSAGPCQATNGMRGGIERGPCRASGVKVSRLCQKTDCQQNGIWNSRPLLGRMCCPSTCHTGVFWRMGGLSFQSELMGANFTWFFPESSQSNLRILVQAKLSSFTKVMMGEHHEVNSGPMTLQDTIGKSLA